MLAIFIVYLTALLLFAGMTLGDYLAYTSFWKSFGGNERPEALLNFMAKVPRLAGIGLLFAQLQYWLRPASHHRQGWFSSG
jgi:hypothetical protein